MLPYYRPPARLALLAALLTIIAPSLSVARGAGTRPATVAATRAAKAAAPGVAWRFTTGGRQIITAPAVGPDGTVYAASSDGVLYAVSPSGRRLWALNVGVSTGTVPPARPAIGPDGTSYWNVRGAVVAVTRTGHLRWVFLTSGGGSPVLAHGHVLFAAGSYLYAINMSGPQIGQAAWRAAIGTASPPTGGPTPAVGLADTAYIPSTEGYLYAIAANGLRRWAFHIPQAGMQTTLFSPAVGLDGTIYLDTFANGHGTLYALSPAGRLRWRLTIPAGSDLARGADGTIYAATHLLVAVSPRGRVAWQRVVNASAPPVAAPGGLALVPTLAPAALLAVGAGGRLRWRVPLSAAVVAPPAQGAGGQLYAGDYAGALTALAPGAQGGGHTINGAAPAGVALDLGAGNAPFIVRGGRVTWRVTVARTVERSADGGRRWSTVLTPGVAVPDPRSGTYRNARYADVAFLAVDPHDTGGLYVGTLGALGDYLSGGAGGADGGLYYKPAGSGDWQRLDNGLSYTYEPRLHVPTYGLDSLVFDPARRGVLYAQTPPAYGSPGHDTGLYKSTDGGHHWRTAMRGLPVTNEGNALIGAYHAFLPGTLLVDRARSSVLFLVAPTGFYRSADGAAHWTPVSGVSYMDPASVTVRIGARGAVRVYADRGVYVSGDYGAHWRRSRP